MLETPITRAGERRLTFAQVQALAVASKPQRARILAKQDPLRNVPQGDFTLADYSYGAANLCHAQFGNCQPRNLGAVA